VATTISIEVEPFGFGADVRIVPPTGGPGHDREHRSLPDARRYASLLSKATGWRLVDCAGDA
jgi:hypothetical protein